MLPATESCASVGPAWAQFGYSPLSKAEQFDRHSQNFGFITLRVAEAGPPTGAQGRQPWSRFGLSTRGLDAGRTRAGCETGSSNFDTVRWPRG